MAQCSARKKYEFLFFRNSYFFWHLYFFRHNVRPEKSMSSFFFGTLIFGALLFLAQCLARKKYEFRFFGTHTFLAQCSARTNMMFLLELILFFWNPYFLSGTMFGLKKYEFLFFFGTHTFLSLCWARKSMSLSVHVFVTHIFFCAFFGTPYSFWHNFWPEKI